MSAILHVAQNLTGFATGRGAKVENVFTGLRIKRNDRQHACYALNIDVIVLIGRRFLQLADTFVKKPKSFFLPFDGPEIKAFLREFGNYGFFVCVFVMQTKSGGWNFFKRRQNGFKGGARNDLLEPFDKKGRQIFMHGSFYNVGSAVARLNRLILSKNDDNGLLLLLL